MSLADPETPPVVLPLKSAAKAKHRLEGILSSAERRRLYLAMLEDVLKAVKGCPRAGRILVVTDDAEMAERMNRAGAELLPEPGGGLNGAAQAAAQHLEAAGAKHMLVLHADLPALAAAELDNFIAAHLSLEAPSLSIAEDMQGDGSNALLCSPPGIIPFSYGKGSCQRHIIAAEARGIQCVRCRLPGLSQDADTPADLAALVPQLSASSHTRALLEESGIALRLGALEEP